MVAANQPGPVPEAERIHALDVLRGLAVLGILLTNIQHFAMFGGTARDPTLWGDLGGANYWVYALTFIFVFQKFLPIFSMLFGAGIVLASERREAAGQSAARLHYRRMALLAIIGIAHAYLLWYGDILFAYAVCGMAVFALRRLPPVPLIVLGTLAMLAHPLIDYLVFLIQAKLGIGGARAGLSVEEVLANDLAAFRGPWVEQLKMRAHYALEIQTRGLVAILFWRASGIMLIGMALYKLGVLTGKRSRPFYAALGAAALMTALPVTVAGLWINVATGWDSFWLRKLGELSIYWFGVVMSLGWIGIVMGLCGGGRRPVIARPFAAVGRMALTCYLMESVLCTLVFYGHGLGLYGRVERTGQIAVVLGVWAILLIGAPLWLRRFRYGPAEWLWRSLSYGKRQPFLRAPLSFS